ncbi:hypothetical protein OGAPHI_003046 [Ogataea philodendri]|uniref:Secreted protein n=1 Tax=Ogataea philodendri TaxID=1378263 RepID=A0A9P8P8N8_9ASCO|nr:uncharacterized protein OGAPHI_003046 [Ogataea philodendri]KAH3667397.1 hypothetical protein OGAPHI_003046 [Ogataea philodendri]
MAKSALLAACIPSIPLMPTPTWAAWIIETSLAPSPIASNRAFFFRFTRRTTRAFCSGETRQQITALQRTAISRSRSSRSDSKAKPSDFPSMTKANELMSSCDNWLLRKISALSSKFSLVSRLDSSFTINRFMSSLSSLQLIPMLIAVSCLSPVNTQTLIPAS